MKLYEIEQLDENLFTSFLTSASLTGLLAISNLGVSYVGELVLAVCIGVGMVYAADRLMNLGKEWKEFIKQLKSVIAMAWRVLTGRTQDENDVKRVLVELKRYTDRMVYELNGTTLMTPAMRKDYVKLHDKYKHLLKQAITNRDKRALQTNIKAWHSEFDSLVQSWKGDSK